MFLRIVATCIFTLPAFAGQVTYSTTAASLTQTTLPRFDPTLGSLTHVRFDTTASVSEVFHAENLNPAFPLHTTVMLATQCTASVPFVPGGWSVTGNIPAPAMMAPFDGTLDYMGSSSTQVIVPSTALGSSIHDIPMDAAALDYFIGTVPLPITVDLPTVTVVWPVQGLPVSAYVDTGSGMTLTVTYSFDAYPVRFCTSDATMACPCGSTMGSTGCPNSVGPGASLVPSGASSASMPTFSLTASGLPTTTTGLLFGGTSTLHVGQIFGDGIRCVAGTSSRLGVQTAQNGIAVFPVPFSPAGELHAYQVWYRNQASFCTPAAFNLTSGVVTVWTP